jgi:transcriptional regulator with XRE-family HTH domain
VSDAETPRGGPFDRALGRAIKVARTERDLDRKALAKMAGISYAHLADIESGRGRPSSTVLRAVAKALGMSPGTLLEIAESRSSGPAVPQIAAMASPAPPSPSDEWTVWSRSRPSTSDPTSLRGELHSLIERLESDDLSILLDLARRLARRPGSA